MPSRLLSYSAVAQLLDCHPRTVKRLVAKGLLAPPATYNGVGIRFSEDDVTRYLVLHRQARQEQSLPAKGGQGGTNSGRAKEP